MSEEIIVKWEPIAQSSLSDDVHEFIRLALETGEGANMGEPKAQQLLTKVFDLNTPLQHFLFAVVSSLS